MPDSADGDGPVDPVEVGRDERLLQEVESGAPPEWFQVGARLARLRDEARGGERVWQEPAMTQFPHSVYDDPTRNPIAFLPVDAADTGDAVDPNAPDPTPDEVTDPRHPDHVEPWTPDSGEP